MAMKPSELSKLNMAFSNIKSKVMEACTETVSDMIEEVYKLSRERAPVQSGNLLRSAKYNINREENAVYGESHFGEPGNVGGWNNKEAYTYMWHPGPKKYNHGGVILYEGWETIVHDIVPEMKNNIKNKF